jgi:hypothetical protein
VNCTIVQRRLLSTEQPEQPPTDLLGHLADCSSCREWQRRLVRMEQRIPLLPLPPSTAKAQLLERILSASPSEMVRSVVAVRPPARWSTATSGTKERGLRKMSLAFALAASLLIFALAWWAWPHHNTREASTVVSLTPAQLEQKRLEERLAKVLLVDAPKQRLLQLADLAEELHGEALKLVENTDKLDRWTRFYSRVVSEDILDQARRLTAEDRPAVLEGIAKRLLRTESEATRLATQLKANSPKSSASFDRIAFAARQGEKDLRSLMRG